MGYELKLPITRPTLITAESFERTYIRAVFKYKGIAHTHYDAGAVARSVSKIYPSMRFPVFFDRGLVCAGAALDELLNERYPMPPLLPNFPQERAMVRLMAQEIREWYLLPPNQVRERLFEFFDAVDPEVSYYTGSIPSLVDFAVLPLLPHARFPLTEAGLSYMHRLEEFL